MQKVKPFDAAGRRSEVTSPLQTQIAELKQALETMFLRIETGEDILEQLERINVLHQELDPTAPNMLRHYLERKSYTKALALLEEVTSKEVTSNQLKTQA